jgi:hypothetical protein
MRHRARLLCVGLLAACTPPTKASAPPTPSGAQHAPSGAQHAPSDPPAEACASAPMPDTPVGRQTTAFLDTISTGDPKQIEAFVTDRFTPQFQQIAPMATHVEVLGDLHDQTGSTVVCRLDYATDTEAMLLVGAVQGQELHQVTIVVEDAAPNRVSSIGFQPAPRDLLDSPPPSLDDAARHTIVEGVAGALDDYIFADVAAKMQARIRSERDAGHYAALTHPVPFVRRLTKDLRAVSDDKHLSIQYSAAPIPPDAAGEDQAPPPEQLAQIRAEVASDGFGIGKVEVLDGNIGYVDIRLFHSVDFVREAFSEAMTKVADSKALIVDLRHNHGGDPATVAFVTSYLFGKKKVHLNDLYYRRNDQTTEYWTDPAAPGKHYGPKKPIYVLTSHETFSGGEEFANNLRELERATLIGETTGGGAHPVDGARIDDHIIAIIPVGRAINPITKTNWEGKGVEPHVAVPASEALDRAKALIAEGRGRGKRSR